MGSAIFDIGENSDVRERVSYQQVQVTILGRDESPEWYFVSAGLIRRHHY